MRGAALLLMASGWVILLAAIALLGKPSLQIDFALAGLVVEIVGAGWLIHLYRSDLLAEEEA